MRVFTNPYGEHLGHQHGERLARRLAEPPGCRCRKRRLQRLGSDSQRLQIQTSSNLASWGDLAANIMDGHFACPCPTAGGQAPRFYRAVAPPRRSAAPARDIALRTARATPCIIPPSVGSTVPKMDAENCGGEGRIVVGALRHISLLVPRWEMRRGRNYPLQLMLACIEIALALADDDSAKRHNGRRASFMGSAGLS